MDSEPTALPEQPMVPVSLPAETVASKSKVSVLVWVVAGVVILGVGISIGLFLNKRLTPAPKAPPAPAPVSVATPTPDPTTNWKTYTNGEFGFSFLFPNEWEACVNGGTVSWLVDPGKCKPPYADYHLSITVSKNSLGIPIYSGPGDANAYITSGKQTITRGANQFIRQMFAQTKSYTWNGKEYPPGPIVIFYDLVDTKDNQVIEFYKSPVSTINENTIDQILSTFKFLN